MASPNHTLPSPDISDIIELLNMMKKQNEEILAKNEEILTKLNSIKEDNRKLRQELDEIKKSSHAVSRKRDDPEDEDKAEHENEHLNSNKKARVSVSVASLPEPEPELLHALDPAASFDTLDDDCLGNVLDFVGKKCYSVFGSVNKRCHEMFCSKELPKVTYLFGYGPLRLIQQQQDSRWDYDKKISYAVLHYNRRDILEWILTDESEHGCWKLKWLCYNAIEESSARLDILRELFRRENVKQLEYLRDCDTSIDLCCRAALCGKLECLEFFRENECGWDRWTWDAAKNNRHEHILEYLRNNGYPTEWQVESDSENEDSD